MSEVEGAPTEEESEEGAPPEEATPPSSDTPDEEEEGAEEPGETDAPDETARAQTERELAKMAKRVETAGATYARKIGEIFGEEAQALMPCPRCTGDYLPFGGIAGFVYPLNAVPVPPEQKSDVLASVGETTEQVTQRDSYSRMCDACEGFGRVFSGSKVNREKTLVCIACKGKGWVAIGDERRVPANNVAQVSGAMSVTLDSNGAAELPEPAPDTDPWGRTPDNPDYGKLPMYASAQ